MVLATIPLCAHVTIYVAIYNICTETQIYPEIRF